MAPQYLVYYGRRPQLSEDYSSELSFQDLSSNEGTSSQSTPLDFSPSAVQMQYQLDSMNSETNFGESPLITGLDPSLYGGSVPQGVGFNYGEQPASIAGASTVDRFRFSALQGSVPHGVAFNYEEAPASFAGPSTVDRFSAHQGSVPPLKALKRSRLWSMHDRTNQQQQYPPQHQQNQPQQQPNPCSSQQNMYQIQQNPFQLQQNPYQLKQQDILYQLQQNQHQLQQNAHPHQQQPNPYQLQQNAYQQQHNSYQLQQSSHQQQPNTDQLPQDPHQQQQNQPQQQQDPHQTSSGERVKPEEIHMLNIGICLRRLIYYVSSRRTRAPDNNIVYWREFVMFFFSPQVKRRTCFANFDLPGNQVQGAFAMLENWKCELCNSTSGKGFVESYDALPRMNQLYYDSTTGVINELMYFDDPIAKTLPDGFMALYFKKAIQECIYKQCVVVHEGLLRVVFTPQLKMIAWDFCVRKHEVFLPRRVVSSQVNNFIKETVRCQRNVDARSHEGEPKENSPSNCNRLAASVRELVATVEQPHINDLGLSKYFVQSLQVSEILNSMKDLMDYSLITGTGPIEALNRYGPKPTSTNAGAGYVQYKSSVQQTQGPPEHSKLPAQNAHPTIKTDHTFQAANSNKRPMYDPPSHYQKYPIAEQFEPNIYPNQNTKPVGPAEIPIAEQAEKLRLNVLLSHMQRERTKRDHSQVNNEVANGKGIKSSSSSNSSKIVPNCNVAKKKTESDEDDFTSPAETQGVSKNGDGHQ